VNIEKCDSYLLCEIKKRKMLDCKEKVSLLESVIFEINEIRRIHHEN